jgi:hypothetical protein
MSIFTALKYGRPDLDIWGDLVAIPFPILNKWFIQYVNIQRHSGFSPFSENTTCGQIAAVYLNTRLKHCSPAQKEELTDYLVKILREWEE